MWASSASSGTTDIASRKNSAAPHEIELVRRGISHHNARAFREAERCYQAVLRGNPRNTDALNLMGVLAVEANRNDIALDYFGKAVKLAPQVAMYRNNLGNALSANSDNEEALPHLLKAAELDPRYLDALCNLGKVYRLLGDMETATQWFEKALAVQPGLLRARTGLAEIDSENGHFDRALVVFESIIADDPRNIEAFIGVAQARKFDRDDPLLPLFEQLLADRTLRADQLAPLHHAFAKVCNDIGRYDDAFHHFTTGKRLKNARFEASRLEEGYRLSANLFTPEFFAARRDWGVADERPFFVVGLPRSGTTLTEQVLASHPDICGMGGLPDMRKLARSIGFGSGRPEDFVQRVARLRKSDVEELAKTYLQVFGRASKPGARRMVDKSPHNYELLGLISLLFPKAHILHCRRDVMDNCVAIYMQNFNDSHGYNRSLADLGRYWRAYRFLMENQQAQLPLVIASLDYEQTVAEPEAAFRRIIAAAGMEWDDACLRFYETDRPVRTPSRWQVRQPIYATSVQRWKRYERHLDPLRVELAKPGMGED